MLARTVVTILAVAAMLTGCAGVIRDRIYRPATGVAAPRWTERAPEKITVRASDGVALTGWFWAPTGANRDIIVYFHGNGGALDRDVVRAEPLAAGGRGVLMTSYRGFSGHSGSPSERGLALDAAAYTDFARARLPGGGKLYLFGHSLGGAVAIAEDKRRAVDGVATLGAFASLADVAPSIVRGVLPDRFDNIAAVKQSTTPLILFHGTMDQIVPFEQGERLAAASGSVRPTRLVPLVGADHHPDMAQLAPIVVQALADRAR
jgi:uncharacterized protein